MSDSIRHSLASSGCSEREDEIVKGIEQGLADMRAGRTVSHEDAMARLRKTVALKAKPKGLMIGSRVVNDIDREFGGLSDLSFSDLD